MAAGILNVRPTVESPDTDLEQRKRLDASLTSMLADAYMLLVGPLFVGLHQLTEEQYRDLFGAIDEIADRIRALGYPAPTSVAEMMPHSAISEESGSLTAQQMVQGLIRDHGTVARRLREAVEAAESMRIAATADLLNKRLQVHEKAVWMLRAVVTA